MRDTSLIIVKPDGARSKEIVADILGAIDSFGLRRSAASERILAASDVLAIWPAFTTARHPFSCGLYIRYMSSGPSLLIEIVGSDALGAGLAIKKRIRSRYEVCAFQNAIHASADIFERDANLHWYSTGEASPPTSQWPEWSKRGSFGSGADLPPEVIKQAVDRIWQDFQTSGWGGVFLGKSAGNAKGHSLELHPKDPNSIDFGIAALLAACPDLSFEDAARIYVEAEVSGRAIITVGEPEVVARQHRSLVEYGMRVQII